MKLTENIQTTAEALIREKAPAGKSSLSIAGKVGKFSSVFSENLALVVSGVFGFSVHFSKDRVCFC